MAKLCGWCWSIILLRMLTNAELNMSVCVLSRWWTSRCSSIMWLLSWMNMKRTCMTFTIIPGNMHIIQSELTLWGPDMWQYWQMSPQHNEYIVNKHAKWHVKQSHPKSLPSSLDITRTGQVSVSLHWTVVWTPFRWRLIPSPQALTPPSATSRACTSTSTSRAPLARIAWADTQRIYRSWRTLS